MGYLDSSTITVDAVLTKTGRKKLAQGSSLTPSFFTLHDSGIDYGLWNDQHSSGSAYYGEAIEKLPMLEGAPGMDWILRNTLVSFPDNGINVMPVFNRIDRVDFGDSTTPAVRTAQLLNYSAETFYYAVIYNNNYASIDGAGVSLVQELTSTLKAFTYKMAAGTETTVSVYQIPSNSTFNIVPTGWDDTTTWETTCTLLAPTCGAYTDFRITGTQNYTATALLPSSDGRVSNNRK